MHVDDFVLTTQVWRYWKNTGKYQKRHYDILSKPMTKTEPVENASVRTEIIISSKSFYSNKNCQQFLLFSITIFQSNYYLIVYRLSTTIR